MVHLQNSIDEYQKPNSSLSGIDMSASNSYDAMLQRYYASPESRIGYRILLGGTRHFGYYESDTWWPFPITSALRKMEDNLYRSLGLGTGSQVLDAGCGAGIVASHLAKKGLLIQCIDIVDRHVKWAHRTIARAGLAHAVKIRKGDYHDLNAFSPDTFDGVYTMETFVHATDPAKALKEFFRVLQPGGSIALYEYDHAKLVDAPRDLAISMEKVNKYAAMPANVMFDEGTLPALLKQAGFVDVTETDLSTNIKPMLWLFFVLAYIPYILITLFGLEPWFINTVAAVQCYRGRHMWRYVATTAKKPGVRRDRHDEQERQY